MKHNKLLNFVPETFNYVFVGIDLIKYLDVSDQNVNQKWLKIAKGN